MKVSKLLKVLNIDYKEADFEVSDIVYDSRESKENCVFVCLKGAAVDGHKYASLAKGAKLIVAEDDVEIDVPVIKVENTKKALALLSAEFFERPYEKIKTVGITGTKGKTTTACMIKSILESAGQKVGMIGTLGVLIGEDMYTIDNTTPQSYLVFKYMAQMVKEGCSTMVMEASSIGLKDYRVYGFDFDCAVFTNFSKDHIGGVEHKDMQEYKSSKAMIFSMCKTAVYNLDDNVVNELASKGECNKLSFGFNNSADIYAVQSELYSENNFIGSKMQVAGEKNFEALVGVPGKFNAYNALSAIGAAKILDIKDEYIKEGLKNVKVKGRVEPVKMPGNFTLLLDYAHNALSMENVLNTLREYNPNRLICVFGAGGNRPRDRRFEMGEVSGNLADLSVITADNSRFEEVEDIIEDIKVGMSKTKGEYIVIPDRKEAIKHCIVNAKDGDLIVLAGKGHEDYQDIKGVKYPFDERVIIKEILESL